MIKGAAMKYENNVFACIKDIYRQFTDVARVVKAG